MISCACGWDEITHNLSVQRLSQGSIASLMDAHNIMYGANLHVHPCTSTLTCTQEKRRGRGQNLYIIFRQLSNFHKQLVRMLSWETRWSSHGCAVNLHLSSCSCGRDKVHELSRKHSQFNLESFLYHLILTNQHCNCIVQKNLHGFVWVKVMVVISGRSWSAM